jgi:Glycosyl hydrolases family 43
MGGGRISVRRWLVLLCALPVLALAATVSRTGPVGGAISWAGTWAGRVGGAATGTIDPGARWTDQHGNPLQLHGLGIVKVGATYYGFGEDKVGEDQRDTSFRAIPCYASTTLARWTYVREALIRTKSGDLGPHRIVERPKVLYNARTHRYVMYLHIDDPTYAEAKVGVATSTKPCGPYAYRGSFRPLGQQSRDIGLFQDGDGTGYLLTEDRAHGLRVDRLSSDYLSVTAGVAVLGRFESPAMVKAGGRYYLLGSHLTGWRTNDNVYATATSPAGPWSAWKLFAPKGSKTFNSQTANVITVAGSKTTTYVYAGDRWNPDHLGDSPLVWLPLTITGTKVSLSWHDSWNIDTATGSWS